MKTVMSKYFARLLEVWRKTDNTLPMTVRLEEAEPFIYVGAENDDGWIQWRPIEKAAKHDFTDIETELGATLHRSIKEYYNSYWFCALAGSYRSRGVSLFPVVPGLAPGDFVDRLRACKDAHGGKLETVPIGLEANSDLLIVVDNRTGYVFVEDHERGTFERLASSLEELIDGLVL